MSWGVWTKHQRVFRTRCLRQKKRWLTLTFHTDLANTVCSISIYFIDHPSRYTYLLSFHGDNYGPSANHKPRYITVNNFNQAQSVLHQQTTIQISLTSEAKVFCTETGLKVLGDTDADVITRTFVKSNGNAQVCMKGKWVNCVPSFWKRQSVVLLVGPVRIYHQFPWERVWSPWGGGCFILFFIKKKKSGRS